MEVDGLFGSAPSHPEFFVCVAVGHSLVTAGPECPFAFVSPPVPYTTNKRTAHSHDMAFTTSISCLLMFVHTET